MKDLRFEAPIIAETRIRTVRSHELVMLREGDYARTTYTNMHDYLSDQPNGYDAAEYEHLYVSRFMMVYVGPVHIITMPMQNHECLMLALNGLAKDAWYFVHLNRKHNTEHWIKNLKRIELVSKEYPNLVIDYSNLVPDLLPNPMKYYPPRC